MTITMIRELEKMGPNTPYSKLLKEQFNMEVPAGVPKYQVEYLYKYALQLRLTGVFAEKDIVTDAATKVQELLIKFPWLIKKYDDVTIKVKDKTKVSKGEKAEYPDGTIIYCQKRNKFLLYVGGKIVIRCSTMDKVKSLATKKLNFTSFVE